MQSLIQNSQQRVSKSRRRTEGERLHAIQRNVKWMMLGTVLLAGFSLTNIALLRSVLQHPAQGGDDVKPWMGPLLRDRIKSAREKAPGGIVSNTWAKAKLGVGKVKSLLRGGSGSGGGHGEGGGLDGSTHQGEPLPSLTLQPPQADHPDLQAFEKEREQHAAIHQAIVDAASGNSNDASHAARLAMGLVQTPPEPKPDGASVVAKPEAKEVPQAASSSESRRKTSSLRATSRASSSLQAQPQVQPPNVANQASSDDGTGEGAPAPIRPGLLAPNEESAEETSAKSSR